MVGLYLIQCNYITLFDGNFIDIDKEKLQLFLFKKLNLIYRSIKLKLQFFQKYKK